MSTPPNFSATASKARRTSAASVTSQARPSAAPPICLAIAFAAASSRSSTATSAPCLAMALAVAAPMPEPPPVISGDLARQRLLRGLAELGLFQRPIFDVELVFLRNRFVAAHGFGRAHHLDRVLGDIGGNRRILRRSAEAEQADARHQNHARVRIELLLDAVHALIVAREIGVVASDEPIHGLAHRCGPCVQLARFGRGHDERPILGADGVIGRRNAHLRIARKLGAVDVIQDLCAAAKAQDLALCRAVLRVVFECDRAAQNGRDLSDRCKLGRQLRGRDGFLAALDALFRERGHLDHQLIGGAGVFGEGEDAVAQQDQALHVPIFVVDVGDAFRQRKTRDRVGHVSHAVAEGLARDFLALRADR